MVGARSPRFLWLTAWRRVRGVRPQEAPENFLALSGQDCQRFRRIVERSRGSATGSEYLS